LVENGGKMSRPRQIKTNRSEDSQKIPVLAQSEINPI